MASAKDDSLHTIKFVDPSGLVF